jgi:hypothetical protein
MKQGVFLIAMLLTFSSSAKAQKTVIFDAMKDELGRSMQQLKLAGEAGP